ncbi:MAG: hypothetical protein VKK42_06720 [Lyngbya sp.]|nr:hypothetical protein [Lyngbya sp.]
MNLTENTPQTDRKVKSYLWMILLFDCVVLGLTILRAVLNQKTPMRYFEETGIISWFSCLKLLVLSGLAWRIGWVRKQAKILGKKAPQNLWKWIAWGFFYLAVDEIVQIHEAMDWLIHWAFKIQETRLTDSIDDVIVVLYSIVGVYILYDFWDEFKRYFAAFSLFIFAFVLKGIMVAFDVYTNDETVFSAWFNDPEEQKMMLDWFKTIEDSFKILAEGVFIAAFIACLQIAKRITRKQITP